MSATHLDEEQVQRFLHDELTAAGASSTRDHVGTCPECRSRVEEAAREETRAFALIERLDHRAPQVDVRSVMRRARRPGVALSRWAAGILLVVAIGGVAYAAPGSPLPAIAARLFSRLGDDRSPRVPAAVPNAGGSRPDADEVTQGIAAAPGDRFTIVFSSQQPGGVAAVSLIDGAEVAVRAVGGRATFTSDVDRMTIGDVAAATRFEIEIPRDARRVSIWVAGRRVFSKEPTGVAAEGPRDATGRYLVPLSRRISP
jgi:hypothetical protein